MAASTSLPWTVGVTGGIGSGKSAVCAIFSALGLPVLSADDIARDISQSDPQLRGKIQKLLGTLAYRPDGTYNRPFVAEKIFKDRSLQRRLESIVHPAVDRSIHSALRELRAAGHRMAVIEAALIFEAGYDRWLDAIVVVDAPEDLRVRRVTARDDVPSADVRRRMRAQLSTEEKRKRADFVIVNDGPLEELERNAKFVYVVLQGMLSKG